jgi:hypothetical protein
LKSGKKGYQKLIENTNSASKKLIPYVVPR